MVSVQCCLSATLPFVWCVLPHNERFFQDHSTFQNRLMARYIDTPARKKLIFPIQNLCNKSVKWFFLLPICFRQVKIKPFLRCWLWFMFVNDLKSQKNGMRHQTIMAFFLLYGKSLLATDMKDTAECMFLMGKQHFQGSWMVQYAITPLSVYRMECDLWGQGNHGTRSWISALCERHLMRKSNIIIIIRVPSHLPNTVWNYFDDFLTFS